MNKIILIFALLLAFAISAKPGNRGNGHGGFGRNNIFKGGNGGGFGPHRRDGPGGG